MYPRLRSALKRWSATEREAARVLEMADIVGEDLAIQMLDKVNTAGLMGNKAVIKAARENGAAEIAAGQLNIRYKGAPMAATPNRVISAEGDAIEQAIERAGLNDAQADELWTTWTEKGWPAAVVKFKALAAQQPRSAFEALIKGMPYTPQAQKVTQPDAFAAAVQGANYSDMRPR